MHFLESSSVLPFSLVVAAAVGGILVTYAYDRATSLAWRLPPGLTLGFAALGLLGFPLATRFGLHAGVLISVAALLATPLALLALPDYRSALRSDIRSSLVQLRGLMSSPKRATLWRTLAYGLGAVALWQLSQQAMVVRPDGIYTGISHNLGDLPFHLSITNRFVYGDNFPPEHPSFAGTSFTYPFIADLAASMFVAAGVPAGRVIAWSTFVMCILLAALIYRWTLDLTTSRTAAFLAPLLTFLNGGLGWWLFIAEATEGRSAWSLLARLPHDYTMTLDGQFRWGNILTTMLATQRALLLGLPLAIVVFHQVWLAIEAPADDRAARRRLIAAGVITGMLPLIHAHTFAVVFGMVLCLALLFRGPGWRVYILWALAIGLPQVWGVLRSTGVSSGAFIDWSVGWDRGNQGAVLFWLRNAGLLIPLIAVAMAWRGGGTPVSRKLLFFYLPFTLCFLVPNVLRLAPWIWDNVKVLVYWFVASIPLVAALVARLGEGAWWRRSVAIATVVGLTLAGALDVWRVVSGAFEARIFDRQGIEFANAVVEHTAAKALVLHAPMYNHPVVLTGRRSLMGYPGHLWSHGLDYGPRERDIHDIYAASPHADELLRRYGIDYIVGPPERAQLAAEDTAFEKYPRVAEVGGYSLFRVAPSPEPAATGARTAPR
jgi:hypothetical protein